MTPNGWVSAHGGALQRSLAPETDKCNLEWLLASGRFLAAGPGAVTANCEASLGDGAHITDKSIGEGAAWGWEQCMGTGRKPAAAGWGKEASRHEDRLSALARRFGRTLVAASGLGEGGPGRTLVAASGLGEGGQAIPLLQPSG